MQVERMMKMEREEAVEGRGTEGRKKQRKREETEVGGEGGKWTEPDK